MILSFDLIQVNLILSDPTGIRRKLSDVGKYQNDWEYRNALGKKIRCKNFYDQMRSYEKLSPLTSVSDYAIGSLKELTVI